MYLPIMGFISCMLMVGNKDEYMKCVRDNSLIKMVGDHERYDDDLLTWLRRLHNMTFGISISYFFLIMRNVYILTFNCIFYEGVLILMVLWGSWAVGYKGTSVCKDTTYGSAVTVFGLISILSGFTMLIMHTIFLIYYLIYKELPEWLAGEYGPVRKYSKRDDKEQL